MCPWQATWNSLGSITTTWLLCMHGCVHDKQPEVHRSAFHNLIVVQQSVLHKWSDWNNRIALLEPGWKHNEFALQVGWHGFMSLYCANCVVHHNSHLCMLTQLAVYILQLQLGAWISANQPAKHSTHRHGWLKQNAKIKCMATTQFIERSPSDVQDCHCKQEAAGSTLLVTRRVVSALSLKL
jgi:hypothetical protein